jgi:hypothetical protein
MPFIQNGISGVFPADGKPPYFWFAGPRYGLHVSVQVPGDADRRPRVTSLAATLEFMVTLIERADLVGGGWRRLFISLLCRILCIGAGTWDMEQHLSILLCISPPTGGRYLSRNQPISSQAQVFHYTS